MFLRAGVRVCDIESNTLRNIHAFGAQDAFFEEDRLLLIDWCHAILVMYNAFELRCFEYNLSKRPPPAEPEIDEAPKKKGLRKAIKYFVPEPIDEKIEGMSQRDHGAFKDLADLCRKIYRKLDKEMYTNSV